MTSGPLMDSPSVVAVFGLASCRSDSLTGLLVHGFSSATFLESVECLSFEHQGVRLSWLVGECLAGRPKRLLRILVA